MHTESSGSDTPCSDSHGTSLELHTTISELHTTPPESHAQSDRPYTQMGPPHGGPILVLTTSYRRDGQSYPSLIALPD
jgi:hypothetical protein